ncbi:MAG: methylated-DNA--[protein]-cysteine S-methyltransferase [Thermodesulfovibrionales bacterium]
MNMKKASSHEFYDVMDTPIGKLFLLFDSSVLTGISIDQPAQIQQRHNEKTARVRKELSEYFSNERTEFDCRTAFLSGTEFERKVWNALKEVPYGETRTYKWIAEKAGEPKAARAVGNALAKNPIPIIFPCHRIIESDGSIGGYSLGGTETKRRLLKTEYYTALSKKEA